MPVTLTQLDQQSFVKVDSSKAIAVSSYNKSGIYTGQKATFKAFSQHTAPAGTAAFFSIYGSSSKLVKILKITYEATVAVAAVAGFIQVHKTNSAISGGTFTRPLIVTYDEADGDATVTNLNAYTVAPTSGDSIGVVGIIRTPLALTGATAQSQEVTFDFRGQENEGIVLRGLNQGIELRYQATTTNATAVIISVLFTEEDY